MGIVLPVYLFLHLFSSQLEPLLLLSVATSLIAAVGLNLLTYLGQRRASKHSDSATLYLLASVLCDSVALTVPSSVRRPPPARCLLHTLLLVLECFLPRANQQGTPRKNQAPEDNAGTLNRLLFAWINPFLLQGYKSLLLSYDLPSLPLDMSAKLIRQAMVESWNRRGQDEPYLSLFGVCRNFVFRR